MADVGLLRREATAIAIQGGLMLRACVRKPAAPVGDRVAVFIHGYLSAGAAFDPMRRYVERVIGISTLDFTYGPLATFESVADRFAEHVERFVPASSTVSLVGHSLGGIVARWFLQEQGGIERVDKLVALATPHAGTRAARYVLGTLRDTLEPGSYVLERLAARRATCSDVPHVAIVAGQDRLCDPPQSAAALEDAEVVWFHGVGHNEMLFDVRVHQAVARALR